MAKAFPAEFRRTSSRRPQEGGAPQPDCQGFRDLRSDTPQLVERADVEEGVRPGLTEGGSRRSCESPASGSSSWSKRTTSFGGLRPIWDNTPSQNEVPAGHGPRPRGHPRGRDLSGAQVLQAGLLQVEGQTDLGPGPLRRLPDHAALDAHHDDPTFGYRFIADELELQGFVASENRVQRLCSMQAHLVAPRQEARPQPKARPSGPRRPGSNGTSLLPQPMCCGSPT